MTAVTGPSAPEMFRHEALYYHDAGDYEKSLLTRIHAAAAAGEPILVAVPQPNLDRLREAIRQRSEAGAELVDAVSFFDMAEVGRNPGRVIPQILQAFVERHQGRRTLLVGEPVWATRTPEEYAAAVQHEALVNTALAGVDTTVLCPYHVGSLPSSWLDDVERTHPMLSESGFSRGSAGYRDAAAAAAEFNRPLEDPPADAEQLTFSSPAELHGLRGFVLEFGARAGLRPERVDDLRAAVNEVATNTLVHTGDFGRLSCWNAGAKVVCEVSDNGGVDDPLFARRVPVEGQIGGNGLVMVQELCDLVQTYAHRSGVVVRLHVGLS